MTDYSTARNDDNSVDRQPTTTSTIAGTKNNDETLQFPTADNTLSERYICLACHLQKLDTHAHNGIASRPDATAISAVKHCSEVQPHSFVESTDIISSSRHFQEPPISPISQHSSSVHRIRSNHSSDVEAPALHHDHSVETALLTCELDKVDKPVTGKRFVEVPQFLKFSEQANCPKHASKEFQSRTRLDDIAVNVRVETTPSHVSQSPLLQSSASSGNVHVRLSAPPMTSHQNQKMTLPEWTIDDGNAKASDCEINMTLYDHDMSAYGSQELQTLTECSGTNGQSTSLPMKVKPLSHCPVAVTQQQQQFYSPVAGSRTQQHPTLSSDIHSSRARRDHGRCHTGLSKVQPRDKLAAILHTRNMHRVDQDKPIVGSAPQIANQRLTFELADNQQPAVAVLATDTWRQTRPPLSSTQPSSSAVRKRYHTTVDDFEARVNRAAAVAATGLLVERADNEINGGLTVADAPPRTTTIAEKENHWNDWIRRWMHVKSQNTTLSVPQSSSPPTASITAVPARLPVTALTSNDISSRSSPAGTVGIKNKSEATVTATDNSRHSHGSVLFHKHSSLKSAVGGDPISLEPTTNSTQDTSAWPMLASTPPSPSRLPVPHPDNKHTSQSSTSASKTVTRPLGFTYAKLSGIPVLRKLPSSRMKSGKKSNTADGQVDDEYCADAAQSLDRQTVAQQSTVVAEANNSRRQSESSHQTSSTVMPSQQPQSSWNVPQPARSPMSGTLLANGRLPVTDTRVFADHARGSASVAEESINNESHLSSSTHFDSQKSRLKKSGNVRKRAAFAETLSQDTSPSLPTWNAGSVQNLLSRKLESNFNNLPTSSLTEASPTVATTKSGLSTPSSNVSDVAVASVDTVRTRLPEDHTNGDVTMSSTKFSSESLSSPYSVDSTAPKTVLVRTALSKTSDSDTKFQTAAADKKNDSSSTEPVSGRPDPDITDQQSYKTMLNTKSKLHYKSGRDAKGETTAKSRMTLLMTSPFQQTTSKSRTSTSVVESVARNNDDTTHIAWSSVETETGNKTDDLLAVGVWARSPRDYLAARLNTSPPLVTSPTSRHELPQTSSLQFSLSPVLIPPAAMARPPTSPLSIPPAHPTPSVKFPPTPPPSLASVNNDVIPMEAASSLPTVQPASSKSTSTSVFLSNTALSADPSVSQRSSTTTSRDDRMLPPLLNDIAANSSTVVVTHATLALYSAEAASNTRRQQHHQEPIQLATTLAYHDNYIAEQKRNMQQQRDEQDQQQEQDRKEALVATSQPHVKWASSYNEVRHCHAFIRQMLSQKEISARR
jgi:hypothetical protein